VDTADHKMTAVNRTAALGKHRLADSLRDRVVHYVAHKQKKPAGVSKHARASETVSITLFTLQVHTRHRNVIYGHTPTRRYKAKDKPNGRDRSQFKYTVLPVDVSKEVIYSIYNIFGRFSLTPDVGVQVLTLATGIDAERGIQSL